MIRVVATHDATERWLALEVSGHAGLSEMGADVLCAAVSVLAENLEAGLRLLLEVDCTIEKREGYHCIRISGEQATEYTQLLFSSAILGLYILQKNHPGFFLIAERSEDAK